MAKRILIIATVLGALGVMIGAFGAHGLKPILVENDRLDTFETAVDYHFYHTFALLFLALLLRSKFPNSVIFSFAALAWFLGILIFSGSLYILSITNVSVLGAITPVGGVFFIAG